MGHGRHVTGSSYPTPTPTPPIADYNVTLEPPPVPDCTCNYFAAGTHEGKPYYRRADGLWYLFWNVAMERWLIWTEIGDPGIFYYWQQAPNESPVGMYIGGGGSEGFPILSAGPH